MDNVLTVKGESKADHDSTGKDYFVREVVYGEARPAVQEGLSRCGSGFTWAGKVLSDSFREPLAVLQKRPLIFS